VTVDSEEACVALITEAELRKQSVNVFIDIDNGMHRTGIEAKNAGVLVDYIKNNKWMNFQGFHVYDGHIHESDLVIRENHCNNDFEAVNQLIKETKIKGIEVHEIACGGTFTFPIHAKYNSRTLCPGTPILWDAGYEQNIPELDFLHSAILVGRVISKPLNNLCLDLGYKSLASEMSHPRLKFLDLKINNVINHSEEHLVISTDQKNNLQEGDLVYTVPFHICPTIALHERVYVVENNNATQTWNVVARKRNYKLKN
ncbi:MAG: alanine racemase, partial [Draconibacterium sp.]|nr:alanine racemase [Draconibacterium sp.]